MKLAPVLVLLATTSASADSDLAFSAGPVVVIPLDDWGERSGIGYGLTLDARYALSPRLAAIARLEPVLHQASDGESTREFALLAGIQMRLVPRVEVTLAAGASYWSYRLDRGTVQETETELGIPVSLAVEAEVYQRVWIGLGMFSPDLVRGGLTQLEVGAHGSRFMLGVTASASVSF